MTSSIATCRLQRLREAGWVLGEPVPDPGRPRQPIVIWRITQDGENELARVEGRQPAALSPPRPDPKDTGLIYTSERSAPAGMRLIRLARSGITTLLQTTPKAPHTE